VHVVAGTKAGSDTRWPRGRRGRARRVGRSPVPVASDELVGPRSQRCGSCSRHQGAGSSPAHLPRARAATPRGGSEAACPRGHSGRSRWPCRLLGLEVGGAQPGQMATPAVLAVKPTGTRRARSHAPAVSTSPCPAPRLARPRVAGFHNWRLGAGEPVSICWPPSLLTQSARQSSSRRSTATVASGATARASLPPDRGAVPEIFPHATPPLLRLRPRRAPSSWPDHRQ